MECDGLIMHVAGQAVCIRHVDTGFEGQFLEGPAKGNAAAHRTIREVLTGLHHHLAALLTSESNR